ncbi:MAG: right-handed parallel beta-helix repeat-containing protein [Treponema sp.]|nr:right-handed parallel beta-helix repeat-containing protein [Treponema sp.]
MGKLRFFGILSANLLLAVTLLAGLVLTACSDNSGNGSGLRTSTYYGESSGGIVEITFSSKSPSASTGITAPKNGDYYIIKLNGVLISSGQITVSASGGELTFVPSTIGLSQFSGTLDSGGALTVPAIPLAGGGTISLPSTNPSTVTVTTVQGAAIEEFDPDYEEITSSGFSIDSSTAAAVSTRSNTGQIAEYAVSKNSTAPTGGWQRGLEFTDLDASTVYYVWARSGARVTAAANYNPGTAVKGERTVKTAASARGLFNKLNEFTAGAAELSDDSTVVLTGRVALGEALEIEEGVTLTVNGTLNIESGGRLNIGGTVDIGAGTWTGSGTSITLTGSGTIVLPSGANSETLNAIIAESKKIVRGTAPNYSGNVVIALIPAFYNTALTKYIVVDPGAGDNAIPYTIRGLGMDNGDDLNRIIPKLGVGMWIANNNVTLENVSFNIAVIAEGLVPVHLLKEDAQADVNIAYGVAVLLARAKTGNGGVGDYLGGSKNVTVQNCAVTIKGSSSVETFTGGIWVCDSPSDIRILGNTVNVTGSGGNAAQALAFDDWGNNIQVKNNRLTAKFANQPDLSDLDEDDFYTRPASAFYIEGFYEKPAAGTYNYAAGDISGNFLSYSPTEASVFSFFVNAYPRPLPDSTTGARKGVAAMGSKKFGDSMTKWVLESAAVGDYHRLVVGDLIGDCKANGDGVAQNGFGAVVMYVSYEYPDNVDDKNIETYKIAGGRITNIGIHALPLAANGSYGQSDGVDENVTVNASGATSSGTGTHMRYWK